PIGPRDEPKQPAVHTTATAAAPGPADPVHLQPKLAPSIERRREPEPRPAPTELRLGQLGLLIAGVVTALFGVGYFLKYSFDHNWIGPVGRVALAYLGGVAVWLAGERFVRRRLAVFGRWLIGGGMAMLYFASFASFQIYRLVEPGTALLVMVAITATSVILSLRHDSRGLALIALLGGYATPPLVSRGDDSFMELSIYLLVLGSGLLWLAARKRWKVVTRLSFACSWLLFLGYLLTHASPPAWQAVAMSHALFALSAASPFAYFWSRRDRGPTQVSDFPLALASSLFAFGVSWHAVDATAFASWASVLALLQGTAFLLIGWLARRSNPDHQSPFVLAMAGAGCYAVLAVPMAVDGAWVTVLWAAQGAAFASAGLRLDRRALFVGAAGLLGVATLKWLGYDLHESFSTVSRWATATSLVAAFSYAGLQLGRGPAAFTTRRTHRVAWAAASAAAFLFANVELYRFQAIGDARGTAVSILWAVVASGLMVLGFWWREQVVRRVALALFAVTAVKVFFVDLARLQTPYRIGSFLAIGMLMVGASYLYHRYRDRLVPAR
ncbi:MAG: DUF2339 domain-containing protein, partial [Deltaproteobacteria bacterium]|nr:DUF2339 domain-containing protein [Deltaproteobacteria bacterium]